MNHTRYGFRDFLFLAYLLTPVFFLTRFNRMVLVPFLGKYYQGFDFVLLLWIMIFAFVGLASPRVRTRMGLAGPMVFIALFIVWAMLAALAVEPSAAGVGKMLFAHTRWCLPLLATYLAFRSLPTDLASYRRAETSFIIAFGVLIALILLGTSLGADSIGAKLGWQRIRTGSTGFTRAWTPVGTSITSGFLIAGAYMLVLPRLLHGKAARYIFVATLDIVAVVFSLARSVVLALILFHLLIGRTSLRKYAGKILIAGCVLLLVNVVVLVALSRFYSFDRLVSKVEDSTQARMSSVLAASEAGMSNPLTGYGYGLLYVDVRDRILSLNRDKQEHNTMVIGNRSSALEPHNMYLLAFAETGFPGLLLFAMFWLLWLRRLKQNKAIAAVHPDLHTVASVHHAIFLTLMAFGMTWSGMWLYPVPACGYFALIFLGPYFGASVTGELQTRQAG